MESQIYKDLDRLLGQDSSHQTNEALAAATESNQTTSHGEDTQGESARPPPVPSGPNSGSSKLSLPLANNIDENEEQDEWAYARDVEETVQVANYLLRKRFYLTALEMHQELLERNGGVAHSIEQLNDIFTDQETLDSLLTQNEEEAKKAAYEGAAPTSISKFEPPFVSDGLASALDSREQKIAFLEYRLRGLQSDYDSVSEQLSHTRKQLVELKSGHQSNQYESGDKTNIKAPGKSSDLKDSHAHSGHVTDMEKKVLNALIRRYFLDVPYSMSAVTFEQECGGIDDSFADLPLENASMPSAEEKFSLLGLYRQQIEPIEELRESSEKVESLVKELESTKEKLEATTQELDITVSERNASEEKLEAANARIESLKNELQSVSQAPGPGGAHGLPDSEENKDPHSPQADKDGNYASLSAAQYLSTLKVNKDIDTSSVMETLSSTLPVLSKAVASKQRGCLLPLFSAVMATHTSSEARRVLGQQMLHLIKKPSEEDQLQILKSVEKLLGKSSNVDAENELLPHVLTMATHRSSERRVLAGRLCGALAPHLSERRVDSVLATLNLLCEDEDTDVIAGVAAGATCVVLSLRKLYMDNAWSSSNPKGNAGLTALRGPVRRQFAELEDLMWRFLIQGPDTTVYGGTTQTANAFGLHGSMQRCIREALTKVDENIDPSSGHVKFDDSFREVGTTLYGDLSLKDSWHIVVKYLLPNMLEWAWELGILWSALLPQFMDLVVDVETSIEHEEKDNDSSHRSGSRGNSSRRGSSSAAPSDSHSAEMSGSYVQDYGVARSQQGSRKMSMEDVQKTEWTTHEVFSISSEFFGKNDTEADLEVIDLNRYLREEPEDLPEEKPLLRCKFFDAVLDGRIVMVEKGTSDKIKDKTEDEILQVISETAFSLQKLSIKCNGYKWLVDTLVPEVFYASFTAPTTTAAGRRIRFAYGSILRAACLAFGNMFTLHFVYPLFLHGLDLKFPDFKRMGVQRTSVDIHELCKEKGIQNITLADYFDCGVLSTAVKTGTEERDFMGVTEEDDQTNFSEQDSRLQRYAWIHYIDRLCWLYSLESSSGQKVNEGSQASYGASNAPFLLPLFGSGTLSVPSLPRSAVAYSIRELLQVVSQKKAGWNATIHTPLVEQCVLSAGAFGGREVMEHLLTTLQRIGSNPSEFVRQCVAGMLSGILGNLDVSLLKKHGVTLVRQLADDEEVSVARIAVRAVTSLYSLKVAMDDKSIRKEVNDVIENTLKSGPTELVVETLRCLMRCVNNAPGELREGFILDKLLETSNALVAASRSDAFKNYGDSNIDSLPLWPGARIDDLEEVAMVCLEAYRAYTSMAGLLSQESKEMIADAVSSLLNDNELLDASYRDMMQASLGSAVTEMREGKVQPEDKHESGVGDFAPVQPTRAEASHEEQPEEFRQAAEAGNVFLAAMKGENFGGDSSASGSDSAAKESSENRSSGRFNKMKARLGFRGKKAS